MLALAVIVAVLVAVLTFAFRRTGPGVGRGTGRSIRRGRSSHVNIDGRPKRSYDTAEQAAAAARRLAARGEAPLSTYRCRDCGKFHLGHG